MREKSHKYDITQCALYKIKGSKQLKKVLCITEEETYMANFRRKREMLYR